ncbi:hypothetical protein KAH55_01860 [bacterium]|nr:hypothetical protein [bacterium]
MIKLIDKRTKLAHQLFQGKCDAEYSDAVIILTSTISAIAAKVWPGEGKDKKRFIETMIRYSSPTLQAS